MTPALLLTLSKLKNIANQPPLLQENTRGKTDQGNHYAAALAKNPVPDERRNITHYVKIVESETTQTNSCT